MSHVPPMLYNALHLSYIVPMYSGWKNFNHLISVRQAMNHAGLTRYAIYKLIEKDPTFPVVNIGPSKNYRVDPVKLKEWIDHKLKINQISMSPIPTADDLLNKYRKKRDHNE